MKRREVLRLGAIGTLAACVPMDSLLLPAQREDPDVRDFGAAGDGEQDDTQAFQSAINALPASGGTVRVPGGRYLINPARRVILRSGLHLDLTGGAVLVGMPTDQRSSSLLSGTSLKNVVITGGRLIGSADGSTPPDETAASFALDLRGCTQVRVERMQASGFGVDGLYVGAEWDGTWRASMDVTLDRCLFENCRRQGVSVTACAGFQMIGCEVRNIGPDLPGSGVDLEPNPGRSVSNAEVRACSFHDNSGFGVMVGGDGADDIAVVDNEIRACGRGGILIKASHNAHVSGNQVFGSSPAISVRGRTSGVRLERNTCAGGGIEVVPPATAEQIANLC